MLLEHAFQSRKINTDNTVGAIMKRCTSVVVLTIHTYRETEAKAFNLVSMRQYFAVDSRCGIKNVHFYANHFYS